MCVGLSRLYRPAAEKPITKFSDISHGIAQFMMEKLLESRRNFAILLLLPPTLRPLIFRKQGKQTVAAEAGSASRRA